MPSFAFFRDVHYILRKPTLRNSRTFHFRQICVSVSTFNTE
jgi:hypothetical protein